MQALLVSAQPGVAGRAAQLRFLNIVVLSQTAWMLQSRTQLIIVNLVIIWQSLHSHSRVKQAGEKKGLTSVGEGAVAGPQLLLSTYP